VRKDLPALIDALGAAQPQVRWRLREAIGEVDAVIEAMAQAALRMAAEPPQ
jgi:sirohydrochlorin cobaltochelatase